jgi:carboxymethylenebutenolidase
MAPFRRLLLALALLPLAAHGQTAAPATPSHPGMMINLNDFGTTDVAYLTLPSREPRGGVIVVHDSWGLTDAVKTAVDRLAREGYVALAPDLMNGQVTGDPLRADDFKRALDHGSAVKTIQAALRCLRESPRFRTARVGLAGWGLGGQLALETACGPKGSPAVDAIVVIGLPLPTGAKVEALDAPLLALFRPDDASSTAAARADLAAALNREKKVAELRVLNDDPKRAATWRSLLGFFEGTFGAPAPRPKAVLGHILQDINPFHDEPAPPPATGAGASSPAP